MYTVLYIGVRDAYLVNPLILTVPSNPSVPGMFVLFFLIEFPLTVFSNLAEETTTPTAIIIGPDFPTTSFKYPWEH